MSGARRWVAACLLGCLAVGLGGACAGDDAPRTNVVIMMIDTLRADRLRLYGHTVKTSRYIENLAKESVVFERAYAPAPWTLPSVVSLMVSAPVCEHNVIVDGQRIDDSFEPLAERLKGAGYVTAAFLRNPYAGEISGLDRGFDTSEHLKRPANGALVTEWLAQNPRRPFFLYLHNTGPHTSYQATKKNLDALGFEVADETRAEIKRLLHLRRNLGRADYGQGTPIGTTDNSKRQRAVLEKLQTMREEFFELYDAQVRRADRRVGMVVAALKEQGLWDETLFILLSDHGEEAFEHEAWGHDQSVYEELIKVPLLVKLPGGEHGGSRIRTNVSLLDVMPTVFDVVGRRELAAGSRGQSLLGLLGAAGESRGDLRFTSMRHNFKKYYRPHHESRGEINVVVVDGDWKGILNVEPDTFELYNLALDPGETKNEAESKPTRAIRMHAAALSYYRKCLKAARQADSSGDQLKADQEWRLRALGYLQ